MKHFSYLVLTLSLLVLAGQASADDRSLLRQASTLESISYDIARELRYSGGYSSLSNDAEKLAREARRFRDAVAGHRNDIYVRARYDEMAKYYERFDHNYRRASFGRQHRHVQTTFFSISTMFYDIGGSYRSYSNSFGGNAFGDNYRRPSPVIIYRSPPVYFGNPDRHRDNRHYHRDDRRQNGRHNNSRRDDRRNHYK